MASIQKEPMTEPCSLSDLEEDTVDMPSLNEGFLHLTSIDEGVVLK